MGRQTNPPLTLAAGSVPIADIANPGTGKVVGSDGAGNAAAVAYATISPVQVANVTLTSAQVLTLNTGNGLTIIPAQANVANIPCGNAFVNYQFVTTAYTDGGGNLGLFTLGAGGSNSTWWQFATAGFWNQGASMGKTTAVPAAQNPTAITSYANSPVNLKQFTANPTLGDGLLLVTFPYYAVTVA